MGAATRACGVSVHGTATVALTVADATGRVTDARVEGAFADTPVAACILRAVRRATFPRFRRPTFTLSYPVRI